MRTLSSEAPDKGQGFQLPLCPAPLPPPWDLGFAVKDRQVPYAAVGQE